MDRKTCRNESGVVTIKPYVTACKRDDKLHRMISNVEHVELVLRNAVGSERPTKLRTGSKQWNAAPFACRSIPSGPATERIAVNSRILSRRADVREG